MAKIRGNTQILNGSVEFDQLSTTNAYTTDLTTSAGSDELARADAIKSYIDNMVDGSLKTPEAYDPTITGNYPTTYGGASIQAGDSFRITAAQTGIGGGNRDVNVEDLLIALVDSPGATVDADWMVAESNRTQATESTLGVAKIATQTITNTGTNDTDIVTPLKLKGYVDTSVVAGAGMVKNTNDFDIVAADNSLTINADDMQVKIGNTNGTSLEVSTTGLELTSTVTGNRTFSSGNTSIAYNGTTLTFADTEVANAAVTSEIPFAITATQNYGNGNGTNSGDVIDQFRADFTDEAIINALVELKANIATSTAQARNGLTMNGSYVELGGALTQDTTINLTHFDYSVNGNNDTTNYDETVYFGNGSGTEITSFNIAATRDFKANLGRDFLVTSTNVNFGNTINSYTIAQTPDGTVPLAISTVAYVDAKVGARKYNQTTTLNTSGQTAVLSTAPTNGFTNGVVYLNGVRQILTTDYTVTNTTTGEVTFTGAQIITTGDVIIMDYTDE